MTSSGVQGVPPQQGGINNLIGLPAPDPPPTRARLATKATGTIVTECHVKVAQPLQAWTIAYVASSKTFTPLESCMATGSAASVFPTKS